MEEVKKSIFKLSEKKKVYKKNYYKEGEPYVDYNYINVSEHNFECDLTMPLLQSGDKFYIEEEDKTVQVAEAIRTSKGNVLYTCYADVSEDKEQYNKIEAEIDKEYEEFKLKKEQERLDKIGQPITLTKEITGLRKFIKKLFKL
jgi:N-acetylmuramoyl-L-alanine amidase CwlA